MKRYHGEEKAPNGVYLNLSKGEFVQSYDKSGVLPGSREDKYIKVPAPLAIVAGPFAGLAFIIFLPFIGIVGLVSFIAYRVWHLVLAIGSKALRPVAISWKPGTAYLTPQGKATEKQKPVKEADKELTELADEINKRRQQGEK